MLPVGTTLVLLLFMFYHGKKGGRTSSPRSRGITFVKDSVTEWSQFLKRKNIRYDGHAGIYPGKVAMLNDMTEGLPAGSMHCEIGLNAGHSAVAVLEGNPNIFVTSFEYRPIGPVVDALHARYGNRITVIPGDSNMTVPQQTSLRCNSIFIDGDHSLEAIHSDARHMCSLSSNNMGRATVIAFDDVESLDSVSSLVTDKVISQTYRCLSELAFESVHTENMYDNDLDWTRSGVVGVMCMSSCM